MLLHGTVSAVPGLGGAFGEPEGSFRTASWMIRLWTMVPVYGLLACIVSCAVACKTIVYLSMRRICDGQDMAEIWVPGEIEGMMKSSLAGRAAEVGPTQAIPDDEA